MPACNVEKYIRECMDSVVNQTLKDIEIIVVNDGSKDGTPAILDEYAAADSRVRVVHKVNTGYGHSNFYDIDGNPVTLREGYAYREYEYDVNGKRIREVYYDQNGNKVLNSNGNAEVRREFDTNKRIIREAFYDIEGELTEIRGGYASREPVYDENNTITGYRYYDIDGNEVKID